MQVFNWPIPGLIFVYFQLFNTVLIRLIANKIPDGWILTADRWCQKQLCHNHWPMLYLCKFSKFRTCLEKIKDRIHALIRLPSELELLNLGDVCAVQLITFCEANQLLGRVDRSFRQLRIALKQTSGFSFKVRAREASCDKTHGFGFTWSHLFVEANHFHHFATIHQPTILFGSVKATIQYFLAK